MEIVKGDCGYYRHTELQATEAGCPFCHPTSPVIVDMNGAFITSIAIEFINANVDDGETVLLKNFTKAQAAR